MVYLVCAYTKICGMGHGPAIGMTGGTLGAVQCANSLVDTVAVSVMTGIATKCCMDIVGSGPRVGTVDSITSVAVRLVDVMTGITTGRYREVMSMIGVASEARLLVMTECTCTAAGDRRDVSGATRCRYRKDRAVRAVMTACTRVMDLVAVGAVYNAVRQNRNRRVMTFGTANLDCNFTAVVNLGAVAMCAGPAQIMTIVTGAAGSA